MPRLPSNPFRCPLSSLPADDPGDPARALGTALFTSLLSASLDTVCPRVTNTNIADPLAVPVPALPNRKLSLSPAPPPEQVPPATSVADKYSALKELDDLFKTTTVQSKCCVLQTGC